jgi:hypothetical protein
VERYFGIPRPARYRAMGETPVEVRRASADSVEPPAPPLPGLPPVSRKPIVAPPAVPPRLKSVNLVEEEADAEELAVELEADSAENAEIAKVRASRPTPPPPTITMEADLPDPELASREETSQLMREAQSRGEIANALMSFARGLFDVCALMVVRDELAFGWKGFGPDLDAERLESLLVPLETKSIFKTACEDAELFVGPAPPSALHGHLFKVLRTSAPLQAVVAPIMIRDRVVNLLYGHKLGDGLVPDGLLASLRAVSQEAAAAYARLIALQKKQG